MATRPQDMSVVKNDFAADAVASAIHDMAETMPINNSRDASVRRMLRRHAREIVALHDDLDETEIFEARNVKVVEGNGAGPFPGTIPAHAEG
jgi:hypothetical protein